MGKLEKESLNVIICSISFVSAKYLGYGKMECTYGILKALPGMLKRISLITELNDQFQ